MHSTTNLLPKWIAFFSIFHFPLSSPEIIILHIRSISFIVVLNNDISRPCQYSILLMNHLGNPNFQCIIQMIFNFLIQFWGVIRLFIRSLTKLFFMALWSKNKISIAILFDLEDVFFSAFSELADLIFFVVAERNFDLLHFARLPLDVASLRRFGDLAEHLPRRIRHLCPHSGLAVQNWREFRAQ